MTTSLKQLAQELAAGLTAKLGSRLASVQARRPVCCALLAAASLTAPAMAAAPEFLPVLPLKAGKALSFPADTGAHPDYKTEWWYATGWLNTPDGKPLGFQVTFFRSATSHDRANPSQFAPKQIIIGHAAIADPARGQLLHDQRNGREGFGLSYVKAGNTDIKLDDWSMQRQSDGSYRVLLNAASFQLDLTLAPTQSRLLQGDAGFSRKGKQPLAASYYYSEPQLRTTGYLTRAGQRVAVNGSSWLDHEWSSQVLSADAAGWDWVGANLTDGGALMAFQIRNKAGAKLWSHATWRDASGKITQFLPEQVSFAPLRHWRSPRTGANYPVATRLTTGSSVWQITPLMDDQELDSRRSTGAVYWEGAVTLERDGQPTGHAYLEMTGYVQAIKF